MGKRNAWGANGRRLVCLVALILVAASAAEAAPRPTNTRRPTPTPRRSPTPDENQPTPTPTSTSNPTDTAPPDATDTPGVEPTSTAEAEATVTSETEATATETPEPVLTDTPNPTATSATATFTRTLRLRTPTIGTEVPTVVLDTPTSTPAAVISATSTVAVDGGSPTRSPSPTPTPTAPPALGVGSPAAFRVAGHFPLTAPPALPAVPNALALGNFNQTVDSNVDLIITDTATDTIRWGESNGRGTFHFRPPIVVGHQPGGLGVADFNGDGEPDVAVANSGDGSISIVIAKGAGKFETAVTTPIGGEPRGMVALGSLLVIADAGGAGVVLATVGGDGTVATVATIGVGQGPVAVVAGDINRDGRIDVAVANRGDNSVSILLASGELSFNRVANLKTGAAPSALALGDLDKDNDLDLVVAQSDDNTVSVWGGDGRGGFALATTLQVGVAPSAVGIIDDVTLRGVGEPHADLVVANAGSNDVILFGGRGNLSFLATNRLVAGRVPLAMVVGQFDNDTESNADVAVAGSGDGALGVLRGQGQGSFVAAAQYVANAMPRAITAGDFDSDGLADIVAVNQLSADVSFMKGNGKAGLNPRGAPTNSPAGPSPIKVASGDVEADGRRDLALVSASGELRLLRGNGDGTFAAPFVLDTGVQDVEARDLNLDGRADLVATGGNAATVWLSGSDGLAKTQVIELAGTPRSMAFADGNGDNVLDLFVAATGSNTVEIFRGVDPFQAAGRIDVGDVPTSVAAADFDQDGVIDVAVLSAASSRVRVYPGLGGGSFAAARDVAVEVGSIKLAAVDVNGDPFPDLVVLSQDTDTLTVHRNDGRGGFDSVTQVVVGRGPTDVVAVDLNANNLPDMVIAAASGQTITVLRNVTVANPPALTPTPTAGEGTPSPPQPPAPPPTNPRGSAGGGGSSDGAASGGLGCALQPSQSSANGLLAILAVILSVKRNRRRT